MLELGQQGPAFALPGVDGATHALTDLLQQQVVVVIFSCNHCPYVQAWEDRMIAIQREFSAQGVQVVAINANDAVKYPDDSFAAMQQRAEAEGFNFLYLHDKSQEIARAYGATRTPEVFLLDGDGVLRYRGAIDDHYQAASAVQQPYLRQAIEAVLAGNDIGIATTDAVGCTIKWK